MAERKTGEAPADAVKDREVQQHDLADTPDNAVQPGLYPTDSIEDREGDNTPDAAHPTVEWDTRIQPEEVDEISKDGAMVSPDIETERK
jgi:hypothetical protein